MKTYLPYFLLLIIIIAAAIDSWGETSKIIMYTIAIVSLIALIFLRATEKIKIKNFNIYAD